ncbi:MAG: hypothetical protein II712_03555 [Erysipelotrichaceae bacterium]|nr:hypothetical protein [Erysipelotrichaceae bacterium]
MDNRKELKIALIGLMIIIILYWLAYENRKAQISRFRTLAQQYDVSGCDYRQLSERCAEGKSVFFYSPQCQGCLAAGRKLAEKDDVLYYDITSDLKKTAELKLEYVPAIMKIRNEEITFIIGFEKIRKEIGR